MSQKQSNSQEQRKIGGRLFLRKNCIDYIKNTIKKILRFLVIVKIYFIINT